MTIEEAIVFIPEEDVKVCKAANRLERLRSEIDGIQPKTCVLDVKKSETKPLLE